MSLPVMHLRDRKFPNQRWDEPGYLEQFCILVGK